MSKRRLVPLNVLAASSAPTASRQGDTYFSTVDDCLFTYNGSTWVFGWDGIGWPALGGSIRTITGITYMQQGFSVALNATGTSVLFGAPGDGFYFPNGSAFGAVFDWVGGVWVPRGAPMFP